MLKKFTTFIKEAQVKKQSIILPKDKKMTFEDARKFLVANNYVIYLEPTVRNNGVREVYYGGRNTMVSLYELDDFFIEVVNPTSKLEKRPSPSRSSFRMMVDKDFIELKDPTQEIRTATRRNLPLSSESKQAILDYYSKYSSVNLKDALEKYLEKVGGWLEVLVLLTNKMIRDYENSPGWIGIGIINEIRDYVNLVSQVANKTNERNKSVEELIVRLFKFVQKVINEAEDPKEKEQKLHFEMLLKYSLAHNIDLGVFKEYGLTDEDLINTSVELF